MYNKGSLLCTFVQLPTQYIHQYILVLPLPPANDTRVHAAGQTPGSANRKRGKARARQGQLPQFENLGGQAKHTFYSDPADQLTHAKLAAKLLTPSKSKI